MSERTDKTSEALAALILSLLLMGPVYLFYGWSLSVLWRWFLVPVFDVSAISVLQAIGITIVGSFFTTKYSKSDPDVNAAEDVLTRSLFGVTFILTLLGIGWIVQAAM